MELTQIRYQQQYQQVQAATNSQLSTLNSYSARDPVTGLRVLETADGGVQMAQYLSNAVPNGVLALARNSTIGLAGSVSAKPH